MTDVPQQVTKEMVRETSDELLRRLRSDRVVYCPIRHHSPACAWHVRQTIKQVKPSAVLVEGPADFTALIPFILHPKARPPFAVYSTFADRSGRLIKPQGGADPQPARAKADIPRFASYYPFCDYSPELVALRAGREAGAELRFIDLIYPQQIMAERQDLPASAGLRSESLLEETYLRRSQYLRRLASRSGCRDVNEVWDHFFENRIQNLDSETFFKQVAAYCCMARLDTPQDVLQRDGTLARERAMASAILSQLKKNKSKRRLGPIVVVTGGFHTVALPYLVEDDVRGKPAEPDPALGKDESMTVLIRYSFDRLDALNGYAAGMPSPGYYDQVWHSMERRQPLAALDVAAGIMIEIGRLTRERDLPFMLSTADEIAALEQSRRLATLRGHDGPLREDLLDGIRSSFVKGAMDAEGSVVMGVVSHVLGGTAVGDIPPDSGVPPLVDDFRRRAADLKLSISDTVRKKLSLDIYRNQSHRRISRLLHSMAFLNAPFGVLAGGPDFVHGVGLDLMHEHWDYSWSPMTESALVEASVYGCSVEEAAVARLRESIAGLEQAGQSRSTVVAVRMLVSACRMGLHDHAGQLLDLISHNIAEDPAFDSLVTGLSELTMLWQSREPLEAGGLQQVPQLAKVAYQRAAYLAQELATCPEDKVDASLAALQVLRQTLAAQREDLFDSTLFLEALESVLRSPKPPPPVAGGASGVLFAEGRLDQARLLLLTAGHLESSTGDPAARTGFLRGLLHTCREVAWRVPELLERLDRLMAAWDEAQFVRALPDLRIAFTHLTPRETDRVAGLIAEIHGQRDLGTLIHSDQTEAQIAFNVRLNHAVKNSLESEFLASWLGPAETDPAGKERPT